MDEDMADTIEGRISSGHLSTSEELAYLLIIDIVNNSYKVCKLLLL